MIHNRGVLRKQENIPVITHTHSARNTPTAFVAQARVIFAFAFVYNTILGKKIAGKVCD